MAVRSGAGTGVIVSLVVFILTTIFMLILAIVFYAGKSDALKSEADAQSALAKYVKPQERNRDVFKSIEAGANAANKSVVDFMNGRQEEMMAFVSGSTTGTVDQVKADLQRLGVAPDSSVRSMLETAQRANRTKETELNGFRDRLAAREQEISEKQDEIERMIAAHRRELETVSQEIDRYGEASREHGERVSQTVEEMTSAVDRIENEFQGQVDELEDEIEAVLQERGLLRSRVDEYETILQRIKTRATTPDLLVDAEVIDVEPSKDLVFINRGKLHRIVLGMTFEVYDDVSSINVNERTGAISRGKASLQVTKVSEATSTCKITRSVPGRPIARGNVLTNAIYDPNYRFKFLVHGKFDVDGDGNPTEAEADYLRSLVVDWGGEVVYGQEVPGDLDFLLLGEMPPMPTSPPAGASDTQIGIYLNKRQARSQYDKLMRAASEAQIPVLNSNRFFVLLGR